MVIIWPQKEKEKEKSACQNESKSVSTTCNVMNTIFDDYVTNYISLRKYEFYVSIVEVGKLVINNFILIDMKRMPETLFTTYKM